MSLDLLAQAADAVWKHKPLPPLTLYALADSCLVLANGYLQSVAECQREAASWKITRTTLREITQFPEQHPDAADEKKRFNDAMKDCNKWYAHLRDALAVVKVTLPMVAERLRVLNTVMAYHCTDPGFDWQAVRKELNMISTWATATAYQTATRPADGDDSATVCDPDCIVWHGERFYSIGEHAAIQVTEPEDMVLQKFLKRPKTRMKPDALADKTLLGSDAVKQTVERLRTKYQGRFYPAIRRPSDDKQPGYLIRVRSANPEERPVT